MEDYRLDWPLTMSGQHPGTAQIVASGFDNQAFDRCVARKSRQAGGEDRRNAYSQRLADSTNQAE